MPHPKAGGTARGRADDSSPDGVWKLRVYGGIFVCSLGGRGRFGAQAGEGQCLVAWLFKADISNCAKRPSGAKMFHSDRASPKSALEKIIALQQH